LSTKAHESGRGWIESLPRSAYAGIEVNIQMKLQHACFPALISAVVGVLLPAANADPLYKRTEVTFHDPVEIPGMVLLPGTYVMKLLDPLMDQDIVRFYDGVRHSRLSLEPS
jgi:hypothetical protein